MISLEHKLAPLASALAKFNLLAIARSGHQPSLFVSK